MEKFQKIRYLNYVRRGIGQGHSVNKIMAKIHIQAIHL